MPSKFYRNHAAKHFSGQIVYGEVRIPGPAQADVSVLIRRTFRNRRSAGGIRICGDEPILRSDATASSLRKEHATQFRFCNESASLPEHGVKSASINFMVVWNRERLVLAVVENGANLYMAAKLR